MTTIHFTSLRLTTPSPFSYSSITMAAPCWDSISRSTAVFGVIHSASYIRLRRRNRDTHHWSLPYEFCRLIPIHLLQLSHRILSFASILAKQFSTFGAPPCEANVPRPKWNISLNLRSLHPIPLAHMEEMPPFIIFTMIIRIFKIQICGGGWRFRRWVVIVVGWWDYMQRADGFFFVDWQSSFWMVSVSWIISSCQKIWFLILYPIVLPWLGIS